MAIGKGEGQVPPRSSPWDRYKKMWQNQPLYMAFIDFFKAFDLSFGSSFPNTVAWRNSQPETIPRWLNINGSSSEPFIEWCQESVIPATHRFYHLHYNDPAYHMDELLLGIKIVYSTYQKWAQDILIRSFFEFQHAGDKSIAAEEKNHLQQIFATFHHTYTKLGLSINISPVPEKTISANRGLSPTNREIKFVLRLDCVPQNTISTIQGIK